MSVQIDQLATMSSPLTRLNYFDGLFLRAELLQREQSGLRNLVFQSNVADGPGIAFGLDASVQGDTITVEPGLAVDGSGRIVLLVERAEAALSELLDQPARPHAPQHGPGGQFQECVDVPPPVKGGMLGSTRFYAVVVRHAESACGWEEVRGRACEDACDATMERPYTVESARVGLCPVTLDTPLPRSQAIVLTDRHLRSQVASSFFADERDRASTLIYGAGLRTPVWCRGAAYAAGICGDDVLVALVAVRAGLIVFLDPWIVRRERMETPPRRYWAGRMSMRPWDVYLAQVLQFQCQVTDLLGAASDGATSLDPCGDARALLGETLTVLDALGRDQRHVPEQEGGAHGPAVVDFALAAIGGADGIVDLRRRVLEALHTKAGTARILIDGGIVELPPAGWLPVDPNSQSPVTRQTADLLGAGVELRYCAIRADQAAGEFESCQHLDRISLLRGLDDPARREQVDILIPDGEPGVATPPALFEIDLAVGDELVTAADGTPFEHLVLARARQSQRQLPLQGVVRIDAQPGGPLALYGAVTGGVATPTAAGTVAAWANAVLRGVKPKAINTGKTQPSEARIASVAAGLLAESTGQHLSPLPAVEPAGAGDGEPVYGWLECTLQNNPFSVARGAGGTCSFQTVWLMPVQPAHLVSIEFNGRYTVTETLAGGGVVVEVAGQVRLQEDENTSPPQPVKFELTLHSEPGKLTATGPIRLDATWKGAPLDTRVALTTLPDAPFAAGAQVVRSDAVADPGEPHHRRAINAVSALTRVRLGEDFAERSASKLFGVTADPAGLRAPLDWVLFRRRIRHDCTGVEARPIADQRVQLWQALATTEDEARRLVDQVRKGTVEHRWVAVGPLVYEGDTARLRTTTAEVQAAWQRVEGGDVLWFAGYRTSSGGIQLAGTDRLKALADALRPAATVQRKPETDAFEMLSTPIADAQPPGFDGAIFAVSLRSPRVLALCVDVRTLSDPPDIDAWEEIRNGVLWEGHLSYHGRADRAEDGSWDVHAIPHFDGRVEVVVWAKEDWLSKNSEQDAATTATQAVEALNGAVHEQPLVRPVASDFASDCPLVMFTRPHVDE